MTTSRPPLARLWPALLMFLAMASGASAQEAAPRLSVVIVVDQMRADFLNRFGGYFTGGLARLLEAGAVFTNGHQDHASTVTAVGHATIATGVFPRWHGIVGNDFFDRDVRRAVYSAGDDDAALLGAPTAPGRSPRRLLRPTVGDWLKASSPASKVYSVATKDRSAIMTGGHRADGAYWYHGPAKGIVTSAYYTSAYPRWVTEFDSQRRVDAYFYQPWEKLLQEDAYLASREDSFPAEAQGENVTFPHRFDEHFADSTGAPAESYYENFPFSPFADELVIAFAQAIVENEQLGRDDAPDLLFIGCSSGDFIGHLWGPLSHEIQDYYLRLDQYLDALFKFLDERIGSTHYVVTLSSDHGVAPAPEDLLRRGYDAHRITFQEFRETLRGAVSSALDSLHITAAPGLGYTNGLRVAFPDSAGVTVPMRDVRQAVVYQLRQSELVADAYTYDEIAEGERGGRPFLDAYWRSFHPSRADDIMVRFKPHYILEGAAATHGSPYGYDSHVPMVFMGPGFARGRYNHRVRTVDVAPTLAAVLGIELPPDLNGRVLAEAMGEGH